MGYKFNSIDEVRSLASSVLVAYEKKSGIKLRLTNYRNNPGYLELAKAISLETEVSIGPETLRKIWFDPKKLDYSRGFIEALQKFAGTGQREAQAKRFFQLGKEAEEKLDMKVAMQYYCQAYELQLLEPKYLVSYARLISNYGGMDKAERLLNTALEIEERTHTNYSNLMYRAQIELGQVNVDLGKEKVAIKNYESAIEIGKQIYGQRATELRRVYNFISHSYLQLNKLKLATAYNNKVFSISRAYKIEAGPELAFAYKIQGLIKQYQGKLEAAMRSLDKSLKMYGALPLPSKRKADVYSCIGAVLFDMGKPREALKKFEAALEIDKQIWQEETTQILGHYHRIGDAYGRLGNYKVAMNYMLMARKLCERFLDPSNSILAAILNNMGYVSWLMGDKNQAQEYWEKTLEIKRENYPHSKEAIPTTLSNLAFCDIHLKQFDKAEAKFDEALEMAINIHGDDHWEVGALYGRKAFLFLQMGDKENGLQMVLKSLKILRSSDTKANEELLRQIKTHAKSLAAL